MRIVSSLLGLGLAVAGLAVVGSPGSAAAGSGQLCTPAGGVSSSLTVTGWVNQDKTYDKAALDALPQTTVADTYLAGAGSTSRNYTGVDLARLLELPTSSGGIGTLLKASSPVGPQTPTQRNDVTRYSVLVTASDCFQAVYAMAEISPFFGGKPVVVATAQGAYAPGDPTPVTDSLGTGGFARISNPVDVRGSRRVSNIVEIRVLQAPAETAPAPVQAPTCGGGPSSSLTVDGFVTAPRTYDAAALAALPQTTVADTFLAGAGSSSANYTGVDLWRLLGLSASDGGIGTLVKPNAPGPQAPAPQRNDLTRYSVMVTGSDCFQALFSLAEISPFFGGRPVLVATAQGAYNPGDLTPVTGSLGSGGFARISNPVDVRGSRRVSNIVDIRVLPAPAPTPAPTSPAPDPTPGPTQPPTQPPAQPAQAAATALAPPSVTKVRAGQRTRTGSILTRAGVPLAGASVQLFVRKHGKRSFAPRAVAVTDSAGRVSARLRPSRSLVVQWRYAGSPLDTASVSSVTKVRVRAT